MEALIVVLLIGLLGAAGYLVWQLSRQRRPQEELEDAHRIERQMIADGERLQQQLSALKTDLSQSVATAQQTVLGQVNSLDQRMNERLDAVDTRVGSSLSDTQKTMSDVNQRLGELGQSTQQMLEVGQDISSLQDILRPPKLRGGFGEMLLERLLAEILPEQHYSTQYRFSNGSLVDAIIRLGNGLVPVDSKFPLESFHRMVAAEDEEGRSAVRRDFVRAVRQHIDSVAKYIQPQDGTFPFALMYVPAENVYYEVIVKDEVLESRSDLGAYALERRVIPVSPNSFYAYLQAIVLGLRGLQVEERAHEILRHLEQLTGEFERVSKDFRLVGNHLKNAHDRYTDADRSFAKFGDRLALTVNAPMQTELPEVPPELLKQPAEMQGQASLPRPASLSNGDADD